MTASLSPLDRPAAVPNLAPASALPLHAIELKGLTKIYAGGGRRTPVKALDGIDLTIPRGCVFGLLGPNGAGKSTTINILAGLVIKTAGTARIWRYDIDEEARSSRANIGIVPQELQLDPFFTPRELLELQAGLFGVPKRQRRTMEILDALGLADKADAYARTLSGGMRRRLMVGKAMVHQPPILVLDEPTAGVDVELRQQLWAYVRKLNAGGTTILLTTHYLEEAQELCDRIAIIDRGRVVADDRTETLVKRLDAKIIRVTLATDPVAVPAGLTALGLERSRERELILHYQPSHSQLGPILAAIGAAGFAIVDVATEESDLEDIFIQLTQRSAHGVTAPDRVRA